MKTNILTLAITLTVGIILAGSLLMPVLQDTTEVERTFINTGDYFFTDDDDGYTITYDPSGKYTVNGEDIAFSDLPNANLTIISTKEYLFRISDTTAHDWRLMADGVNVKIADMNSTDPVTIVFNDGTVTVGGTDYTYTSDSFRGLSTTGDYVRTNPSNPVKINHDTTIIIGDGLTNVTAWYNRFYIEGTADDMTVIPPTGITVSNIQVNTTAIDKYVDLAELNSITFTATDGDTHTVDATYINVIAPKEVTAERAGHLNDGEIAIMNAIPFMIIAALVIMAAGALYLKRED